MKRKSPALAKRRIEPTWSSTPLYVETFGPEVADVAALAGFGPDPEQQLILDLIFAIGPNGKSVAFEIGIIGPRQNFKTGVIKQAELGWLFVTGEKLVVHSAHELDTTEAAFNDLRSLIEDTPELSRYLDPTIGKLDSPGVTQGNGKWSIFVVGQDGERLQIKYKARTATGGRGLTGNKIVLDEGFAVTEHQVGSLYPTLTAVPDPQVVMASSAGLLHSKVLRSIRDRGRSGKDPRLGYVEYADKEQGGCRLLNCDHARPPNNPPGCALDDVTRWKKFMTALGRRTTVETIRNMRRSMPPEEFAREFMVWWEDPPTGDSRGAIDIQSWALRIQDGGCLASDAAAPGRAALMIDVSPDRRTASVAAAGEGPDGRTLVITTSKPGMDWVVPAVVGLIGRRDIVDVALVKQHQAGALIPKLNAAGVKFTEMTKLDAGQACGAFIQATSPGIGQIAHVGQPDLDRAVGNAITRWVGEVQQWDRRDKLIDISPVVSAAGAAWRWSLVPKEPPPSPELIDSGVSRRRSDDDFDLSSGLSDDW